MGYTKTKYKAAKPKPDDRVYRFPDTWLDFITEGNKRGLEHATRRARNGYVEKGRCV